MGTTRVALFSPQAKQTLRQSSRQTIASTDNLRYNEESLSKTEADILTFPVDYTTGAGSP